MINRKRGAAFLAVIGFIILTAVIAEAFLIYFYNQYRITLQKILYEKTFYIVLSGIEWAKAIIKVQDSYYISRLKSSEGVRFNDWSVFPSLRYPHNPTQEYPDLPYNFILILKFTNPEEGRLASYCETEISMAGGVKIFANRRVDAKLKTAIDPGPPLSTIVLPEEEHWGEITPASPP